MFGCSAAAVSCVLELDAVHPIPDSQRPLSRSALALRHAAEMCSPPR
jgi:hypothetical protein